MDLQNEQESRVQNSTRKHTKHEEKVKLDREAHQDARQTGNWTPARNKAHDNLVPEAEKRELGMRLSTWSMKITSFALNNSPLKNISGGPNSCR